MIYFHNSSIEMYFGTLQNCSAQNYTIYTVYNTNFYIENTQFFDFHSRLIYSGLGFITIDDCFFDNFNCEHLENESAIKLENKFSINLKNSIFQYLDNFAKVIFFLLNQ